MSKNIKKFASVSELEAYEGVVAPFACAITDDNGVITGYKDEDNEIYLFQKGEPYEKKHYYVVLVDGTKILLDGMTQVTAEELQGMGAQAVSVEFPSSVTLVTFGAFAGGTYLTEVKFNGGVEEIGESAFINCESLTSIETPSSLKRIIGSAFLNCSSMSVLTLNEGLEEIGEDAFFGCSSLTSITIPISITRMDYTCFNRCVNISSIYVNATSEPCTAANGTFSTLPQNGVLHVKQGGSAETFSTWLGTQGNLGYLGWTLVADL